MPVHEWYLIELLAHLLLFIVLRRGFALTLLDFTVDFVFGWRCTLFSFIGNKSHLLISRGHAAGLVRSHRSSRGAWHPTLEASGLRVSGELAPRGTRDEIIWLPYSSLDWWVGHLILVI